MKTRASLRLLLLALASCPALAQVAVTDAWVRGTVPGQKVTGAFMQLKSDADATLVGIASPAAQSVELHAMKSDGGLMKMRAVDTLTLPAGKVVELKPGGYHVMLVDVTRELREGATVPFTLTFLQDGKRSTLQVDAKVRALGAPDPKR